MCRGTGENALIGTNAQLFGKMVCRKAGFDDLEFIGGQTEYEKFMIDTTETWNFAPPSQDCIPKFKIAGGKCSNGKHCELKHYSIDGGTCIKGRSDVFIHCTDETPPTHMKGEWAEWESEPFCSPVQFSIQKFRKCNRGRCTGRWMQVETINL